MCIFNTVPYKWRPSVNSLTVKIRQVWRTVTSFVAANRSHCAVAPTALVIHIWILTPHFLREGNTDLSTLKRLDSCRNCILSRNQTSWAKEQSWCFYCSGKLCLNLCVLGNGFLFKLLCRFYSPPHPVTMIFFGMYLFITLKPMSSETYFTQLHSAVITNSTWKECIIRRRRNRKSAIWEHSKIL